MRGSILWCVSHGAKLSRLCCANSYLNSNGSYEEREQVAKWLLRCRCFCEQTVALVITSATRDPGVPTSWDLQRNVRLSLFSHCLKPIRSQSDLGGVFSSGNFTLNEIMRVYKLLHDADQVQAETYLLFPVRSDQQSPDR